MLGGQQFLSFDDNEGNKQLVFSILNIWHYASTTLKITMKNE